MNVVPPQSQWSNVGLSLEAGRGASHPSAAGAFSLTAIDRHPIWGEFPFYPVWRRVGCGIYDIKTAAEFGQAIAIARGTPQNPRVNPEDLFAAEIVDATPLA